ncbi:MAG: hypothetical protein RLZZ314_339, partial [Bacteroidota bacterium]
MHKIHIVSNLLVYFEHSLATQGLLEKPEQPTRGCSIELQENGSLWVMKGEDRARCR